MADAPSTNPSLNSTGLSDEECQEFHKMMMDGTKVFAIVAAVAHLLVFAWMPWFPG